jgi:hypothetical protein
MKSPNHQSVTHPRLRPGPRSWSRVYLSLPALITTCRAQRGGWVKNLSAGGAHVQVVEPFDLGCEVVLSCGSIEAEGLVVWKKRDSCGILFFEPIDEGQVIAQLAQSDICASRRLSKFSIN